MPIMDVPDKPGTQPGPISRRKVIAVIILDVVVVAELAFAMHAAGESEGDFTLAFLKVFFALLIPTLIMSRFVFKKLRASEAQSALWMRARDPQLKRRLS